ncbi:ANTH-domain-containing protein [Pleurotus eryngii]|uniref:ANTH-domain-containing protein n=1 Tax=Pleurotus eryngii TaxID=5323 RepID=A0A9P6DJH1_PLEER|nr:ANTH-domain-containing protein [Pleurotus eryngii]
MSSYDKVVKLACKPKAAPPKAKYLDTIIAATWSEDGAVHDVCKALSPRFREPNVIVVFKALIVLHTMIRNGSTDNILAYLSSSDVLKLRNVSSGNWEGYSTPQNLQNYARYLDARIRAYRDLKHDAIRVQAESNRDMRNSQSIEQDTIKVKKGSVKPATTLPARSKTIMGRKLRVMTVEKGLLRETKAVHRMIDALLECRFYLDDLEDELVITSLRMLVKDLLILFQAGNEGVINVLEHYFEMSHIDAEEALAIYRHFCNQTERVVEYLGVAKKLQNLLNVPIPNLKHAPVSLAGALQEYLDDPNFEQNRLEYRANGRSADKAAKTNASPLPSSSTPSKPEPPRQSMDSTTSNGNAQPNGQPTIVADFFSSIEEQQPNMFNPQTNSPGNAYFQQQAVVNPFVQRQMVTATPTSPGHRPFSSYIQTQQTGFFQTTNSPAVPSFPSMGQQPQQQMGQQPQQQQPFMAQQQPQPTGFLQPQATGSNPFRQSMIAPQTTGMALFGVGGQTPMPGLPSFASGSAIQPTFSLPSSASTPFGQPSPSAAPRTSNGIAVPARPASTPLTSFGASSSSPHTIQPVKTHQTGTRNPFGPITTPAPPVPKQPTLMELTMGKNAPQTATPPIGVASDTRQIATYTGATGPTLFNGFGSSSALSPGSTDMSSIASSFNKPTTSASANDKPGNGFPPFQGLSSQDTSTTTTSAFSSSSLFSQQTGTTASNATSSTGVPFASTLKPQTTGFSALRPFKPTSSFGASLLESLPPIPASDPNTPAVTGVGPGAGASSSSATTNVSGFGLPTQKTGGFGNFSTHNFGGGSSLGSGLRPQMTGGGGANPFRASMVAPSNIPPVPPMPTGMGASLFGNPSSAGAFGSGPFGQNAFGSSAFNPGQQQQQQQNASLI